jgi:aminoglycoside phosphotransferase (APT) family kinase protein
VKSWPDQRLLDWVIAALGPEAGISSVDFLASRSAPEAADSLRHGTALASLRSVNLGPWSLRVQGGGLTHDLVLRAAGSISAGQIATAAAALKVLEAHALNAPRLFASDLTGDFAGVAATLETTVPGNSAMPGKASRERLREAGAAIARVHSIALEPSADLPLRIRPRTQNFALLRRWAVLYRASEAHEKSAVIQAMSELTGRSADQCLESVNESRSSALLQLADDSIRDLDRPRGRTVLVHGDPWAGNMRWDGTGACVALIDWKAAGVGDPGVDLGALRLQMTLQYGLSAADHVLDGWQCETGRQLPNIPYWDIVAAISTPTEIDLLPGFDDGGERLDGSAVTDRRDAFLRSALDRLLS